MSAGKDIANPDYYKAGGVETAYWMYWTGFYENAYVNSAVKYLSRVGKKTVDGREDLRKTIRYLEFALELTPGWRPRRMGPIGNPGTPQCSVQDFAVTKDLSAGVTAALKEIELGAYVSAIGYVRGELNYLNERAEYNARVARGERP